MKITLPDGTTLDTSGGTPSRRSNKVRSGRTNVKQYHGRQTLAAVGGTTDLLAAIALPADAELCKVVPTITTGWKEDGAPRRF